MPNFTTESIVTMVTKVAMVTIVHRVTIVTMISLLTLDFMVATVTKVLCMYSCHLEFGAVSTFYIDQHHSILTGVTPY